MSEKNLTREQEREGETTLKSEQTTTPTQSRGEGSPHLDVNSSARERYFSADYEEARAKIRGAIKEVGGVLKTYPLAARSTNGEPLTIDVGRVGPSDARRALIISSGTHGVEGFFGSAVQLATLREVISRRARLDSDQTALIIIHAVNPYGFAHLRRVNEDNIDLNRNFMRAGEEYTGADPGYVMMDSLLNPQHPPKPAELFMLRGLYAIARHGFNALKRSVAQGQYTYPRGLFFGGAGPSESIRILQEHLPQWIGKAEQVTHLDLHTGLGAWGSYVIAGDEALEARDWERLIQVYGEQWVQPLTEEGVLYPIRGELTAGCKSVCPDTNYEPLLVEFGTYPPLRVLAAMRRENQATHACASDDPRLKTARQKLREMFAPADIKWRQLTVSRALEVVERALDSLRGH